MKTIFIFGIFFYSQAFSQNSDFIFSKEFDRCSDKAYSTSASVACVSEETKRQDLRLNQNYQVVMKNLTTLRQQSLTKAQKLWVQFRDANCAFYFDPEGGTITRQISAMCFLTMTKDRADELSKMD
jgi:uncharacterized protein YecT (DUF1311 family)